MDMDEPELRELFAIQLPIRTDNFASTRKWITTHLRRHTHVTPMIHSPVAAATHSPRFLFPVKAVPTHTCVTDTFIQVVKINKTKIK